MSLLRSLNASSSDRVVWLLACSDYGFESRRGHGCLCCVLYSKDIQDKETSTDKVQRKKKRIKKIPPRALMSVVIAVCCQVDVSATGRSPVQRSPTDCGVACMWSRDLKKEDALARLGLLRQGGRKIIEISVCRLCDWILVTVCTDVWNYQKVNQWSYFLLRREVKQRVAFKEQT